MPVSLDENNPRVDFVIEEESHDIFLTGLTELPVLSRKSERSDAAQRGELVIFPLANDAGFTGRIILDELSAVESAEWIGRATTKLSIPEGQLLIDSGSWLSNESARKFNVGEGFQWFDVPTGEYQLTIYVFLNSAPGDELYTQVTEDELVRYFESTRGGESMPGWLADLADDLDEDVPDSLNVDEDERELIDFLFQLIPASGEGSASELREDGSLNWEVRLPERCPLGVEAIDLDKVREETTRALMEGKQAREQAAMDAIYAGERRTQERQARADDLAEAFRPLAEPLRQRQFGSLLVCCDRNFAEKVVPFIEQRLETLKKDGYQVDPINPVFSVSAPRHQPDLDLWRLDDEFTPPTLLDEESLTGEGELGEVNLQYRDPEISDIFNMMHQLNITLLVLRGEEDDRVVGINVWGP